MLGRITRGEGEQGCFVPDDDDGSPLDRLSLVGIENGTVVLARSRYAAVRHERECQCGD